MTPDSRSVLGPYVERSRADWAELAEQAPITPGRGDPGAAPRPRRPDQHARRPRGLPAADPAAQPLRPAHRRAAPLDQRLPASSTCGRTPFVIGIAGSVAVGKSTTARLLRELLAGWPEHPRVALVTTDGFLLPNAELERRGLMHRKGFPESYDRRALLRFVMDVKSGADEVTAPVYSHLVYDIVPDAERGRCSRPDILIIEGLNVLQPARVRADGTTGLAVSDFFDFSVYVDADADDVRDWYVSRFLSLRETAFRDPRSYFTRYAELTPERGRPPGPSTCGTPSTGPNLVAEHPAHPRPGHRHPAQGRRPPGGVGADPQGLTRRIRPSDGSARCIRAHRRRCSCRRVRSPEAGQPLRSLAKSMRGGSRATPGLHARCGAWARGMREPRRIGGAGAAGTASAHAGTGSLARVAGRRLSESGHRHGRSCPASPCDRPGAGSPSACGSSSTRLSLGIAPAAGPHRRRAPPSSSASSAPWAPPCSR